MVSPWSTSGSAGHGEPVRGLVTPVLYVVPVQGPGRPTASEQGCQALTHQTALAGGAADQVLVSVEVEGGDDQHVSMVTRYAPMRPMTL